MSSLEVIESFYSAQNPSLTDVVAYLEALQQALSEEGKGQQGKGKWQSAGEQSGIEYALNALRLVK